MNSELKQLVDILFEGDFSCVVCNNQNTKTYSNQGVQDLLSLYENTPEFLSSSLIADKVVGKGAAALMVLGRVKQVYAAVISTPALELLTIHGIDVHYETQVPNIINRAKTGICPVETLCLPLDSLDDMLLAISSFVHNK